MPASSDIDCVALCSKPPSRLPELLHIRRTKPGFWAMYGASSAVDLGLCLYFFLYPLFLAEHHFTVRSIGLISSALTLGTLTGTLVVGAASRRIGLRPLLFLYVVVAPLCLALRTQFLLESLQLVLSFLSGAAMSLWIVAFSPVIAGLTSARSRGLAFGLFMATGIGSGALAGVVGGFLPGALQTLNWPGAHDGLRAVLLLACAVVFLAAIGLVRLRPEEKPNHERHEKVLSSFLVRFLAAIAVWNFAISFFTPFANVYLARRMGLSTASIGVIYTASQLLQVAAVLVAPLVYRRSGLVLGIAITQLGTALAIWGLSLSDGSSRAIGAYLALTALQWMSGPGITTLLMNHTPEANRANAAAMNTVVSLAAQAAASAVGGRAFDHFGYSAPLAVDGCVAAIASLILFAMLGHEKALQNEIDP